MHYNTPKLSIEKIREAKGQIRQILEKADRNGDGIYTKHELKSAFRELGSLWPRWRTHLCIGQVDANDDGEISGDEIEALVGYIFDRVKKGHYKIKY